MFFSESAALCQGRVWERCTNIRYGIINILSFCTRIQLYICTVQTIYVHVYMCTYCTVIPPSALSGVFCGMNFDKKCEKGISKTYVKQFKKKRVMVWIYEKQDTISYVPTVFTYSKGTVSRDLKWVLLYINRKLFSRAIVAHHKILILLKGQCTKEDPASERLTNSRWSAQF